MRFLGPARLLLTNLSLQTKYLTPRNLAQYVNYTPTSSLIMADSSIPQARVLSSDVDEPARKRLRLDDDDDADIDNEMEDQIASTSQPTKNTGLQRRIKKKSKKKREPPFPELCSAADVLYQEIRSILGEDVVDGITSEGGAFKSPYSRGDEMEVTIDRISAGGKFMFCLGEELGLNMYAP